MRPSSRPPAANTAQMTPWARATRAYRAPSFVSQHGTIRTRWIASPGETNWFREIGARGGARSACLRYDSDDSESVLPRSPGDRG
eukprot:CAMPEP_0184725996 /NCGR_PEP_ID=MMETSP0314-20130426/32463_1 /TAXON_ID=38298 /ORGANISM="Rhodella maculata, Strain CCMP 736" /LENGTH=84 /DNA_ID=CAMNT_0027191337 /DNA_START=93 /DNA_END=347 /DNA_ORIENTATION=+